MTSPRSHKKEVVAPKGHERKATMGVSSAVLSLGTRGLGPNPEAELCPEMEEDESGGMRDRKAG